MTNIFNWLDSNINTLKGKLLNQLLPISVCAIFYIFFISSSHYFIANIINPTLVDKISPIFHWTDVLVGFFLYFVTAIDYALIVGRMQISNHGSKARVVMNIATVMGCYVGVTLVLFLWGFAKEISWLIIPILIFAGSVMIKLAFEGIEYFKDSKSIPKLLSLPTIYVVDALYYLSRAFTFWMPEISKPSVKPMKTSELIKWSFLLPFVIGLDDLIGYMGAMTIYNVFGLLIGIYFADIFIDILIFVSPKFTKKVVESATLSIIATFAFLFLAYKSYSEALGLIHEKLLITRQSIFIDALIFFALVLLLDVVMAKFQNRKTFLSHTINLRR
ncbi:MAG: hypothetical protein COZ34_01855 [Candidatus Pacebacteria bacterium CG_4_10_14_3_um_filter_34_15]|nr:hypothetical protein [Candidatus Pacearchaeota archaeon]NCS86992.1 hypothetical protein [Candidatus Paceibacterota bacterium]OIO44513.1 MAG: hypothetical protein AUJ41_02590 [Candidatus Pacebacteria bacterium CG1_02_43_31]PIX81703.1 MAG: hypothetical protein COZ34_01855 [Candidatus Pacebacteria bacterium CG_4_10_14_3_um_filter_34_15]